MIAIRLRALNAKSNQEVEFYVNKFSYNVEDTWYEAREAMQKAFGHRNVTGLKRLDPPGVYVEIETPTPKWAIR